MKKIIFIFITFSSYVFATMTANCVIKHDFLIGAANNNQRGVEKFVENGININYSQCGNTAIYYSARNGNYKMFSYLLSHGATIENRLLTEAIIGNNIQIIKYFISNGAIKDPIIGRKVLNMAINKKNFALVQLLVKNGIKLNNLEGHESSPLVLATYQKNLKMLNYLLENGANINHFHAYDTYWDGEKTGHMNYGTPLMSAVGDNNTTIIKWYVENGATINVSDGFGTTPLMLAAGNKNLEITKYLIQNGANIYAKDNRGKDAMEYAYYAYKWKGKIISTNTIDDFEKILK